MKTSLFRIAVTCALSGVLVLTTSGLAQAEPTFAATKANTKVASEKSYSDDDVVEFLVFGSGPIARSNPDVLKRLHLKSAAVSTQHVQAATRAIVAADQNFNTHVTRAILSGNPYAVERHSSLFRRHHRLSTTSSWLCSRGRSSVSPLSW